MPLPERIVLVGFMGAGKSTVGRMLAARLRRQFVDTDSVVEARAGEAIGGIFAGKGEAGFREKEAVVLEELGRRRDIVVATGGGAPVQPRNAWFFSSGSGAATFHLRVSLAAARERTRGGHGRPLLERSAEEVRALYESRLSVYESMGTGVDTDGREPAEVVEEIVRLLEGPRGTGRPAGGA